jgi:micrococcal nuclease
VFSWIGLAFAVLLVMGSIAGPPDEDQIAVRDTAPEATTEPEDEPTVTSAPEPAPTAESSETAPREEQTPTVEVTRIIDGDTIDITGGERVRLIGMDTPETHGGTECFGREASDAIADIIPPGTPIEVEYDVDRTDRYGRTLAYVYRARDQRFVNDRMVERGFAVLLTIPPNVAHVDELRASEQEARENLRGLWLACLDFPEPPPTTLPPPAPPTPPPGNCNPNYAGCVPVASDVDCAGGSGDGPAYASGPIQITGSDIYGLDSDSDGVACE